MGKYLGVCVFWTNDDCIDRIWTSEKKSHRQLVILFLFQTRFQLKGQQEKDQISGIALVVDSQPCPFPCVSSRHPTSVCIWYTRVSMGFWWWNVLNYSHACWTRHDKPRNIIKARPCQMYLGELQWFRHLRKTLRKNHENCQFDCHDLIVFVGQIHYNSKFCQWEYPFSLFNDEIDDKSPFLNKKQ